MARNPPTYPAETRSLGENLVNDRWIWCSAQVRLLGEWKGDSISVFETGEPTICSHCYSVPYMKIPANNQVIEIKMTSRNGIHKIHPANCQLTAADVAAIVMIRNDVIWIHG